MTKQIRKFISTLRQQFKAADDKTKQQIWHILTALRGPDEENSYMEKESTTAIIRYTVFGKTSRIRSWADVESDNQKSADFRIQNQFKSYHFRNHAEEAFKTLNLKWDEVNIPKTKKKGKK